MSFQFFPLGDSAVTVQFGNQITEEIQKQIRDISAYLDECPPKWMIEYVPAFTTVTFYYDLIFVLAVREADGYNEIAFETVCKWIQQLLSQIEKTDQSEARRVEIPVCYGGEFGPDLDFVANYNQLTPEEVIDYHSAGNYTVYMIGFAPGFPYIGGLDEKISAPRRKTPRLAIPSGSVGIAGKQTGIYSIQTPGGWQIIGQTPLKLFRPHLEQPSLLKAGDQLTFKAISPEEFFYLKEQENEY